MAYTNPWLETAPTDASDADQLGAVIRVLKLDIRERMNSILATDGKWDVDDPIVVDAAGIGAATGLKHYIPFSEFMGDYSSAGEFDGLRGFTITKVPLRLSAGCVITQLEALAKIPTSGTGHVKLQRLAFTGASAGTWSDVTSLSCVYNANGLYNIYSAAGLSITIGDDYLYQLHVDTPFVADEWAGLRVTYNRPSLGIDL